MKRTITCLAVINCISGLLLLALVTSGCSGSSGSESKSGEKTITSFSFTALNNPKALDADVAGVISGNTITVDIPHWTSLKSLTAKFETTGELVECSSYSQTSGVTVNDFTGGAVYKVTAEDGSSIEYTVNVTVGVPNPVNALESGQPNFALNDSANDLALKDNYLFIAAGESSGLTVVDITDPANPEISGNLIFSDSDPATVENAYGVAILGNYAYVSVGNYNIGSEKYGFAIVDISDPENPAELGHVKTNDCAQKLKIDGNLAFVSDYYKGLCIIDINNLSAPAVTGWLDTTGYSMDVEISGNYAYVADSSSVRIIDISNPSSPALENTISTGIAYGLTLRGSYLYVASGDQGFKIVDISNHASIVTTGTYDTSGSAMDVTVEGSYAFIADSGGGLAVVDISNPASPGFVASINTSYACSVVIEGRYAYITAYGYGLSVIKL